jgi:CHRD domain/Divergent InlB B-repeat domain/Putative Ig domain/Dockerin type I domain
VNRFLFSFALLTFAAQTASAAVTASLSTDGVCGGATTANFAPGGASIPLRLCLSTTTEKLCGVSYRFKAASASVDGHFHVATRLASVAFNELTPATLPAPILATPVGDLGAAPNPQTPIPAGADQLVASLTLAPQSNALNASYVIALDTPFSVALVDQDDACGALGTEPIEAPISASISLAAGTPPAFVSASSATFTVGFPGTVQIETTGNPTPTVSVSMGSLPSGVSFNGVGRRIEGTPALGTAGTHTVSLEAVNGNSPNAIQSFTLTVQKANQAINFDPLGDRAYSAATFTVAASATSTLTVAFSSSSTSNCTVSGNVVTMLATGTCTIVASQGGNANFNAASPISRSFQITGAGPYLVTPSAGANGAINPTSPVAVAHGATTSFTVTPNAGYVASVTGTCGGVLSGTTFTTASITDPCTVIASFVALITYNLVLEGAQETPPLAVTGTGGGTAVVNTVAKTITLNLTFAGTTGALNAAHLHGPAARGMAAGARHNIGLVSPITNVITYAPADEADILNGLWYVNLHTSANGGGELRAQLDNLGAANKSLSVSVTGNGAVTGTGINCPGDCTESYTHNTVVALAATPAVGHSLSAWGGACSGAGACNVTMNFLKSVSATFTANSYVVSGVASPPAGGNVNCTSPVAYNTNTTCTAVPNAGYALAGISGCGGTPGMTSPYTTGSVTGDCTVTATFAASISFQRAVSRKNHGATAGDRDITLLHNEPIAGNVTTEPRAAQSGGHLVVFIFDAPVTSHAAPVIVDGASQPVTPISVAPIANELHILLPALTDGSRAAISVAGVNGALNVATSIGFLFGDVTNSRRVTAADIAAVKAAGSQSLSGANFRSDVNLNGTFTSIDISAVKSRAGQVLP